MKVTISYAALIDGAPDARTVKDNSLAMARRIPVILINAEDWRRVLDVLRTFAELHAWAQRGRVALPGVNPEALRAAAEIVKEIEGS